MTLSAPPRALSSMRLDVVEVHRDVADVAGEAHALAVGRDVEVLVDVRAVEQHACRCRAWPSTVSLPSPGSHWKTSSPAPSKADVVALVAVDEVVAVAAEQSVGAVAAEDRVVAGAAVDGDADERRRGCRWRENDVVAAVGVERRGSRWCRCRC